MLVDEPLSNRSCLRALWAPTRSSRAAPRLPPHLDQAQGQQRLRQRQLDPVRCVRFRLLEHQCPRLVQRLMDPVLQPRELVVGQVRQGLLGHDLGVLGLGVIVRVESRLK